MNIRVILEVPEPSATSSSFLIDGNPINPGPAKRIFSNAQVQIGNNLATQMGATDGFDSTL